MFKKHLFTQINFEVDKGDFMALHGYGFAQVGPYMAPYVGMAAATMATIGTSAVNIGRYGLNQAYDAATAPKARATIAAVGSAAVVSVAKDYYYGMSDVKNELADMKYALDHLQQHFPEMKEFNLTDRDDTFRKIQDLSKEVKELKSQHKSATELLIAVNQRVSAIWDRCDPQVKDLMQKQGLAQLTLSTDNPENSAMQMASWVDATRQCHVDKFSFLKEATKLNKEVTDLKKEVKESTEKAYTAQEKLSDFQDTTSAEVKSLSEIKGQFLEVSKTEQKLKTCEENLKKAEKAERDCAVAKAKLEPKESKKESRSWTSTFTFGLFG